MLIPIYPTAALLQISVLTDSNILSPLGAPECVGTRAQSCSVEAEEEEEERHRGSARSCGFNIQKQLLLFEDHLFNDLTLDTQQQSRGLF